MLLRRLAVFSGGFTVESAQDICGDPPLEARDVLPLLTQLVDRCLVAFDAQDGRYRLLQTIHHLVTRRLVDAAEAEMVRDRHAAHFLEAAERCRALLDRGPLPQLLASLERDHDNLRTAMQWTLASGDGNSARRMAVSLTPFWSIRGHYSEAQDWFRRILAHGVEPASPMSAWAAWCQGHIGLCGMDLGGGLGVAETERAVALARRVGEAGLLARALTDQGLLQIFVAPDTARATLEQAIEVARGASDEWALATALAFLAFLWILDRDRADRAEPLLDELQAIATRSGSPYWHGWHGMSRGLADWRGGRLVDARRTLESAVDAARELGDPMLEAYCTFWLVDVRIGQGDYAGAAPLIAASLERLSRSARIREEFVALRLAIAALASGNLEEARGQVEAILPIAQAVGLPLLLSQCLAVLGRVALMDGHLDAARAAFGDVAAMAEQVGSPWSLVEANNLRGRLARAEGDPTTAELSITAPSPSPPSVDFTVPPPRRSRPWQDWPPWARALTRQRVSSLRRRPSGN